LLRIQEGEEGLVQQAIANISNYKTNYTVHLSNKTEQQGTKAATTSYHLTNIPQHTTKTF